MFMLDVVKVRPLAGHCLEVTFEDGLTGTVDLDRLIDSYQGIFAPLLDPDFFRQVQVDTELGTICWPNGADVDPDMLYALASGKALLVNGTRVFN